MQRNIKFLSEQQIYVLQLENPTLKSTFNKRKSLIDDGGDILNKLFSVGP